MNEEPELDVLLRTELTFPPPPGFAAEANWSDPEVYARAEADPEGWWESWAEGLEWIKKWDTVRDWRPTPREVVRGRKAERQRQLSGPACEGGPGQQGRISLGGRRR